MASNTISTSSGPTVDHPEVEDLKRRILKQVEFYFSDANLPKDHFLWDRVTESPEGWVSIATLATFRRLEYLSTDTSLIASAVRRSRWLLEVDTEGTRVRRREQIRPRHGLFHRTLFAKGFPQDLINPQDEVEAFFSAFGRLEKVKLRRREDKQFKGSVFVEFNRPEDAYNVRQMQLLFNNQPIVILTKEEYLQFQKTEDLDNGTLPTESVAPTTTLSCNTNNPDTEASNDEPSKLPPPKPLPQLPYLQPYEFRNTAVATDTAVQTPPLENNPQNVLLVFSGVGDADLCVREDIKAFFKKHEAPTRIRWIEYAEGSSQGIVMFAESDGATKTLAKMGTVLQDGICGDTTELRLPNEEEEAKFWEAFVNREYTFQRRRAARQGVNGDRPSFHPYRHCQDSSEKHDTKNDRSCTRPFSKKNRFRIPQYRDTVPVTIVDGGDYGEIPVVGSGLAPGLYPFTPFAGAGFRGVKRYASPWDRQNGKKMSLGVSFGGTVSMDTPSKTSTESAATNSSTVTPTITLSASSVSEADKDSSAETSQVANSGRKEGSCGMSVFGHLPFGPPLPVIDAINIECLYESETDLTGFCEVNNSWSGTGFGYTGTVDYMIGSSVSRDIADNMDSFFMVVEAKKEWPDSYVLFSIPYLKLLLIFSFRSITLADIKRVDGLGLKLKHIEPHIATSTLHMPANIPSPTSSSNLCEYLKRIYSPWALNNEMEQSSMPSLSNAYICPVPCQRSILPQNDHIRGVRRYASPWDRQNGKKLSLDVSFGDTVSMDTPSKTPTITLSASSVFEADKGSSAETSQVCRYALPQVLAEAECLLNKRLAAGKHTPVLTNAELFWFFAIDTDSIVYCSGAQMVLAAGPDGSWNTSTSLVDILCLTLGRKPRHPVSANPMSSCWSVQHLWTHSYQAVRPDVLSWTAASMTRCADRKYLAIQMGLVLEEGSSKHNVGNKVGDFNRLLQSVDTDRMVFIKERKLSTHSHA
ncbi:hypothetical protein SeLEV6574_g03384 [Synchytrium endobioticum]|uniref:HTH La-type RNA-binding domain-containing protein n=1 Tax=Synchytrium endobioticum TaxID=286115 RepID=A0A507D4A3_9FUNG|nr:hypothetical protein SeLEV6574_g03384 [Synchytrium endobioticum]